MKFTAFLFLLLVVKSFSLKCSKKFECTGNQEGCNEARDSLDGIIGGGVNGQVQTCEGGRDRCAVIFLYWAK